MAEKRVSVRLAAVGGRQVRAELEGVGEAGSRGFGRLSREMEAANARLAAFSRRVRVAAAAAVGAAAAAGVAMIRSGLQTVDAQAKLAQSLGTTVASIQTLERAGELAGVSMSGIEQATKDLTRRLSQAAAGTGPAADALDRLGLSASELIALPLDQRVGAINAAIENFVPAAERAAVAGQLFGEEGSIAMSRIDTATLRQATEDVLAFGVVVSEQDADQIERTNDAISRLGLIWRGLSNQLAVAAAPALEAVADAIAVVASRTGPLGIAIRGLFDNIGRLTTYTATFAAFLGGRWVAGLAAAALSVRGLATALVVLRGALIRTGIGALIVGAGELIYQFTQLAQGAGGFGNAMALLGDVASEVWDRIKLGGESLSLSLQSVWASIRAGWLSALQKIQKTWADFLHAVARGLDGIPGMESTMLGVYGAAVSAGSAFYETAGAAAEASAEADRLAASARAAANAAVAPLSSIEALRQALSRASEWQVARADEDYDAALVEARRITVDTTRITSESFPMAVPPEEAERRCRRALMEAWVGRETAAFRLPPSRLALDPADVVRLAHDGRLVDLRLVSIADAEARGIEAVRQDRGTYDLPPGDPRSASLTRAVVFGAPDALLMNLPQLTDEQPAHRPFIAAHAVPWPGEMAVFRSPSTDGFELLTTFGSRARIGMLVSDLYAGPTSRFDLGNALVVDLLTGTLESVTDLTLFGGVNALAVETAPGIWEIIQAGAAELLAPGRYRLTRLLRGQRGTESAMGNPTPAGARVVVLDATLTSLPIAEADLGIPWNWRIGPASRPASDETYVAQSFTPSGVGLRPFSVAHVEQPWRKPRTSDDLTIRWTRRSRALAADSWGGLEVPLGEELEAYEVEILDGAAVKRVLSATTTSAVYAAAHQTADWGALLGSGDTLDVRIFQLSALVGRGAPKNVTLTF